MNPVLFEIGNFSIRWYSIFLVIAFVIGFILIFKEGKRLNIDKDYLFNMMFWTVLFSILGARIYYVLFNFGAYSDNLLEIFKVWHGGLAIHGGIIAGLITVIIYTKKYNVNVQKIIDLIVPSLILGQAIGRWGNFFNSEAHGAATTLEALQDLHIPNFIINGMNINGVYYQPTFLYESLWCIIGFILLLIIRKFIKHLHNGELTAVYLIWYGIGRFFIEMSRTDSLMLGSFKVAQIISIVFIIIGIVIIIIKRQKNHFEDLYNEKLNDEIKF